MHAQDFIIALKGVQDKDLKDALNWSTGKAHPLDEPQKFINMHKKPLNMEKILKQTVHNYFMKCTQASVRKYPRNVVKQVTMEMELKQKALPKLIKNIQQFYPDTLQILSKKQICYLGCSTFGCHYDYGNNPVCDTNFCGECSK